MKSFNLLTIIFLSIIYSSCTEEEKDVNKLFSLETSTNKTKYTFGETVQFSVSNKKNREIGTINYHINDEKIDANEFTFTTGKLGTKTIKATFTFNDDIVILKKKIEILSQNKPRVLNFEIVNEYPHDINAYTQGLRIL